MNTNSLAGRTIHALVISSETERSEVEREISAGYARPTVPTGMSLAMPDGRARIPT